MGLTPGAVALRESCMRTLIVSAHNVRIPIFNCASNAGEEIHTERVAYEGLHHTGTTTSYSPRVSVILLKSIPNRGAIYR